MKKLNQTSTHRVFTDLLIRFEEHKDKAFKVFEDSEKREVWYTTFAQDAITKGMQCWYVGHDLTAAKQWFYLAAKCTAISTTKPVGNETFWALHPFMFPLLSDNLDMIALYATLSPLGRDDKPTFTERRSDLKSNEFDIYLVQLALQKDDTKLQEHLAIYKAKNYKRQSKYKIGMIHFMEALLKGDVAQMESAIAPLGEWELGNPTTEDFLASYAVVLCKLAWLRGYEVQVDNPLVPMEFMPVAPLAHYDDVYEFLKPDWQALPPTLESEKKPSLFAKLFGK
jgi:hypothetical protein